MKDSSAWEVRQRAEASLAAGQFAELKATWPGTYSAISSIVPESCPACLDVDVSWRGNSTSLYRRVRPDGLTAIFVLGIKKGDLPEEDRIPCWVRPDENKTKLEVFREVMIDDGNEDLLSSHILVTHWSHWSGHYGGGSNFCEYAAPQAPILTRLKSQDTWPCYGAPALLLNGAVLDFPDHQHGFRVNASWEENGNTSWPFPYGLVPETAWRFAKGLAELERIIALPEIARLERYGCWSELERKASGR